MTSVLDLIGETPLVEVTQFDRGPCRLFLKLESANPSGSIKDRPARTMIEAAEADGRLKPGGTIVEATAGNTGLGLALVGGRKGYRIVLVVPDKMAREKILHCRAMGAEVVLTRSDVGRGHPDYYQDLAEAITARTPGALFINQFANPANPLAHEQTTGPEILRQMQGQVDAIVVGVGSGGTLTGIGRFMAKASPRTRMILADPLGSVLAPAVETGHVPKQSGNWAVEGIGEDFVPPNADLSLVHKAYAISDRDSFAAAHDLLRQEGVLAGSSSGTLLAAALRYCREQSEPQRVVSLVSIPARSICQKCSTQFTPRRKAGTTSAAAKCATWCSAGFPTAKRSRSPPTTRCALPSCACALPTCRSSPWSMAIASWGWSTKATCSARCSKAPIAPSNYR
jgi:cystathionine beta-synthase